LYRTIPISVYKELTMARLLTQSLVLALSLVHLGCVSHAFDKSNSDILSEAQNTKYQLTCTFHGKLLKLDNGSRQEETEYLTISDRQSGTRIVFKPSDPGSLQNSNGFFTKVWSPNSEWLVLPLGRFEGFRLIKSSQALEQLQNKQEGDFVRVQLKSGVRLWHHFDGWQGPASFLFDAGLSDRQFKFVFNIADHSIRPLEKINAEFVVVTSPNEAPVAVPQGLQ
jgi:hypothetical protein